MNSHVFSIEKRKREDGQGNNNDIKTMALFGTFLSWRGYYKSPCEELADQLDRKGWKVIRISDRLNKAARLTDMICTAWKMRNAYDVAAIEVYSGPAFVWAEAVSLVLKYLKKPYVLTLHGGNLPAFSRKWPVRVRRMLTSAHQVTTPSRYLLEQMKRFRDDLILIPNPIHIGAYGARLRKKAAPKLVWLRNFRYIYNPLLAPRVVDCLVKRNINADLTMIGPDSGDGTLEKTKKLARQLHLMNRIQFPGGIEKEEVPAGLQPHDIFINTTFVDNTPISVMEAMACGLCVVSTNVGGIPYLLEHEKDGLLVPPDDPEAMAAAVQRILEEPGLSKRLSRNARLKAERFSWDRILPMWEDLLNSVIC